MKLNRHINIFSIWLLTAAFWLHSPVQAQADRAATARTTIAEKASRQHVPSYRKSARSGAQRLVFNASSNQEIEAIDNPRGSDVLEIFHVGEPGANHTLARFDGELIHTQYKSSNWRLRSWGDKIRTSNRRIYSAMIQLTTEEASVLRSQIAAARLEQGPEDAAGPNWEAGHIKTSFGRRSHNCVATWCDAQIGTQGEPLWKIIGLNGSFSGAPKPFQQALEHDANDRVFGLVIYGPSLPQFIEAGKIDPAQEVFSF